MTGRSSEIPWSVPVALQDVPESGRRFELVADDRIRAAVAEAAGLPALKRLVATFDVTRHRGDGLRVAGEVSATVGQICIVTLDPIENEITEAVDVVFLPGLVPDETGDVAADIDISTEDPPEPLIDGKVDLGAIAAEFLMLGIDPYPRKPGVAFEVPHPEAAAEGPFAALAALQKLRNGNGN